MKYTKTPKGLKYNLYLYHNDIFIGKYALFHNDIKKLTEEYSNPLLLNGFKNGLSIDTQIQQLTQFCDQIAKMKRHCIKVKMSDLILFMNSAFGLFRYKKKSSNDFILFKKKKKKKVNILYNGTNIQRTIQ